MRASEELAASRNSDLGRGRLGRKRPLSKIRLLLPKAQKSDRFGSWSRTRSRSDLVIPEAQFRDSPACLRGDDERLLWTPLKMQALNRGISARSRMPPSERRRAALVRAVRVKNTLGDIQTYRGSLRHGRLPLVVINTSTMAHRCRRGASTPSACGSGGHSRSTARCLQLASNALTSWKLSPRRP